MKRLILIASGGLLLASANAPLPTAADGASPATQDYPRCSATVTDRCIQRDGRRIAAAPRPGAESELSSVVAAGPPAPAPAPAARAAPAPRVAEAAYPPCTAALRDRCTQRRGHPGYATRTATRRVQLALRAGERG